MNPANLQLPDGLREDDLIDLVDGRLPREREAAVLAALRDEPGLANMVKGMRIDMVSARATARVAAPAGLADAIEAKLQSSALRDLAAESNERTDAIPISTMDTRGPGWVELLTESVWPRRLAMAASVAIIASLGVWGVRAVRIAMPKPVPTIVHNTPVAPAADEIRPPSIPIATPTDIALIDPASTTELGPEPVITPAPVAVALSEARAAELAGEGRLTVTVHTRASFTAVKRLDALAKAGGREGWQSIGLESVPAELAMLLMPSQAPLTPLTLTRPTTVASDRPAHAPDKSITIERPTPTVRAIYTVDVNPGEKGMSGLMRALTDALPEGATIELRETARRPESAISMDPENVLWWNAAPGRWSRRITVPVVVEGLE